MSSNEQMNNALEVGTRITCYWPDDDQWYNGTVANELDNDRFWVSYDDGDEGEINIKQDSTRATTGDSKDPKTEYYALEKGLTMEFR